MILALGFLNHRTKVMCFVKMSFYLNALFGVRLNKSVYQLLCRFESIQCSLCTFVLG